jgi:hypothetical protein
MFGIFTTCAPPAYAADNLLKVNAAWADGELLKIEVTDENGVNSTLALRFSDYVNDKTSEYISIQAVDLNGNKSETIKVKNPYYVTQTTTSEPINEAGEIPDSEFFDMIMGAVAPETTAKSDEKPLTPDGDATLVDNVFEANGKEIFSVVTEQNNVFYLIVDRQRESDNVYLLNAVTEQDLLALAQKNGTSLTVESTTIPAEVITASEKTTETTSAPEAEIKDKTGGFNSSSVILIIVGAAGVGGAAYYFKIHKKKISQPDEDNNAGKTDDSEFDEYEEGDDIV